MKARILKSISSGLKRSNKPLKDIRAKIVQSMVFFFYKFLLQPDDELLVSEMQEKKLGATDFVSEIKRVENNPDFEKF